MIKGLPERLIELRHEYHLSQRTVAKKVYVSSASIAAYETGERTRALRAFWRLCGFITADVSDEIGTEGFSDK